MQDYRYALQRYNPQTWAETDQPPSASYLGKSPSSIASQIMFMTFVDFLGHSDKLLDLVRRYAWHSAQLHSKAVETIQAIRAARMNNWSTQLRLCQEHLRDLVALDMAQRFYETAHEQFQYSGPITVEWHQHDGDTFRVPIETTGYTRTEWVFYPIEKFQSLVSPHALNATFTLRMQNLRPQAYWVAEKVESVRTPQLLDPILCAQFSYWFAGIAKWL